MSVIIVLFEKLKNIIRGVFNNGVVKQVEITSKPNLTFIEKKEKNIFTNINHVGRKK